MKKQFKILTALGTVLIFAGSIIPIINLTSCGSKPGQKPFDPATYVYSDDDIQGMFMQLINGYKEQAVLYKIDHSAQEKKIQELNATFELKKEESLSAPVPSQYLADWICETAKTMEVNIVSWQYADAHRSDYHREFMEKEGGTDNAEMAAQVQDEFLEQSSDENLNYNEMMEELPEAQNAILRSILQRKRLPYNYTAASTLQSKYQTACEAQMANLKQDLSMNISLNTNFEFYDYLTNGEEQQNGLTNDGDTTSYWADLLTNLDGSATPAQDPVYRFLTPAATATLFNYNYLEPATPAVNSVEEDGGNFTRTLAPLNTAAGAIVKYKYPGAESGYSVKIAVQVTSRTDNTPVYSDVNTGAGYNYQVNYKIVLEDEDHKFIVPGANDENQVPIYSVSDATLTSDSDILWKKFVAHKFQELGLNNNDVVGAFGVALNNDASWRGTDIGEENYNVVKFSERYADPNQDETPLIGAVLSPEDADAMIKIKNIFTPSDSKSWSSAFSNVIQDKTGTNPEYISVSQANEILSKFFDGDSQYQLKVTIAGVADWGDDDPKIILSTALFDTAKDSNMAPYKLVGMSTTNPPYGFTSENMSKLSFDNYKNNMTNDFNKIQIALPFSNEQLKNFEMCNNMLQPGKMEQIDKIVNFCKPHILDELTDSLKSLLSTGQAAVGFHITFLVIWAIKLVVDIILLVYACLALPFTIGLVVKCGVNIATDAIAIVATSFELAAQVDENEKTAKLIELLDTYEKNCATYYEQIQTHYDTVNTNLEAYKNSNNPTARAAHSTIVHDTNILLINLISQNCWNFWRDGNILAGIPNDKNIFFNNQSWNTWLDISTNVTFIADVAIFLTNVINLLLTCTIGLSLVTVGVPWMIQANNHAAIYIPVALTDASGNIVESGLVLSTRFSGKIAELSVYLQEAANLENAVSGSSIAGMVISVLQLIAKAVLLSTKNRILEKISGIKIDA